MEHRVASIAAGLKEKGPPGPKVKGRPDSLCKPRGGGYKKPAAAAGEITMGKDPRKRYLVEAEVK